MATVEIEGVDEVIKRFGKFKPAVEKGLQAIALVIKGWIQPYPEARPESQYRRTMGLFKSWTISPVKNMGVTIGNNRSYAPFVQDRDRQAAVHQGIWQTVQDAKEEFDPKVGKMLSDVIQEELK